MHKTTLEKAIIHLTHQQLTKDLAPLQLTTNQTTKNWTIYNPKNHHLIAKIAALTTKAKPIIKIIISTPKNPQQTNPKEIDNPQYHEQTFDLNNPNYPQQISNWIKTKI